MVQFYPSEAKIFRSEAKLSYDNMEAFISISGVANNSNVYLSKNFTEMDDTFITLQSQQTIKIINKSAVKVNFEWRAFSTEKEELEKKARLLA